MDWGSGSKPVQRYLKDVEDSIKIDKNPLVEPDILVDIDRPLGYVLNPFMEQQADHAFCMEVLEHTVDPLAVLKNIYDNLKPGGMLHLSVPSLEYPEHGEDYLRFTKRALEHYASQAGFRNIHIWEIEQGYIMEAVR